MTSTNDIRRSFLDFFEGADHVAVPSAPLVPYNDPTLMFVNAGMVPFKNVFTGLETPPGPRAASSQKCVRAGGKHNDLDNVGYTARHHTFFEMLGNFSFGDYFKEQAILNAWTLLTREWGLPAERLLATVYHTDDEAFELWRKISSLPEDRIIRIATNDNFWSMGETGPCGPCSEIFFDHGDHITGGPPGSPDEDGDRFTEIWNLVFMQFDQSADGTRRDLPSPSIDTGMGLERVAAVMQGEHDNYDTDTFKALIAASEGLTNVPAIGDNRASHRVIADHLRSTSFLMADGVLPSNEGRGYVLRRIMRRAMRHAHLLGAKEPLMHRLVPALVTEMGQAYPELQRGQPLIEEVLLREETQFRRTLEKGLKLLDEATGDIATGGELDGETAFRLYDTYGFPYDLTEDALRDRGIGVDQAGFDAAMARQKEAARAAWKGSGEAALGEVWFDIAEREGASEFTGYSATSGEGCVVAIVKNGSEVSTASAGDDAVILTNQTPFYGESGGQTGDTGAIATPDGFAADVTDTSKPLGRLHAHHATIRAGEVSVGDNVQLEVDAVRRGQVRANHSATHLVHAALRNQLGDHVTQKGSLVAQERLRFDFSHPKPLSPEDIDAIEAEVNAEILANEPVSTRLMSPDDAVEAGALALFGEKYGDEVRVLSMGRAGTSGRNYSVELCGGTHVSATGDIGLFRIISESAVSSGVRRIEALTGDAARTWLVEREDALKAAASAIRATPEEVPARITALIDERKRLEKELAEAKKALALGGGGIATDGAGANDVEEINGVKFFSMVIEGLSPKELKPLADEKRAELGSAVITLIAANPNANTVVQSATSDLAERFDSTKLIRVATEAMGGKGGGGRPDMAQGGGPAGIEAAENAIAAVKQVLATVDA
ncbi:MAG: alanine--tRNA ligase [Pseudomonadota bacterium]